MNRSQKDQSHAWLQRPSTTYDSSVISSRKPGFAVPITTAAPRLPLPSAPPPPLPPAPTMEGFDVNFTNVFKGLGIRAFDNQPFNTPQNANAIVSAFDALEEILEEEDPRFSQQSTTSTTTSSLGNSRISYMSSASASSASSYSQASTLSGQYQHQQFPSLAGGSAAYTYTAASSPPAHPPPSTQLPLAPSNTTSPSTATAHSIATTGARAHNYNISSASSTPYSTPPQHLPQAFTTTTPVLASSTPPTTTASSSASSSTTSLSTTLSAATTVVNSSASLGHLSTTSFPPSAATISSPAGATAVAAPVIPQQHPSRPYLPRSRSAASPSIPIVPIPERSRRRPSIDQVGFMQQQQQQQFVQHYPQGVLTSPQQVLVTQQQQQQQQLHQQQPSIAMASQSSSSLLSRNDSLSRKLSQVSSSGSATLSSRTREPSITPVSGSQTTAGTATTTTTTTTRNPTSLGAVGSDLWSTFYHFSSNTKLSDSLMYSQTRKEAWMQFNKANIPGKNMDIIELWTIMSLRFVMKSRLLFSPVAKQLSDGNSRRVLDIHGIFKAPWGWQIAMDYPNAMVYGYQFDHLGRASQVSKDGPPNYYTVVGDSLLSLPFEDGFFDVVTTKSLWYFLQSSQWDDVLREIYRVLKPEGAAEIVVCDYELLNRTDRDDFWWGRLQEGIKRRNIEMTPTATVPGHLKASGFTDVNRCMLALPVGWPGQFGSLTDFMSMYYSDSMFSVFAGLSPEEMEVFRDYLHEWPSGKYASTSITLCYGIKPAM